MKRLGLTVLLVTVAPAVALFVLALGGSLSLDVPGLPSPGAVTAIGLPLTKALRDVASMLTVGAFVVALTCVPPADRQRDALTGTRRRLVDLGGRSALVWCGLNLALVAFTYSEASGERFTAPGFTDQALFFAEGFDLGRYLVATLMLAATAAVLALVSRGPRVAGIACLVGVAALWPMALAAHGLGALRHDLAVDVQYPHLVAIAAWGGGLIVIGLHGRSLGKDLKATLERYSTLATWCFVVVAVSGTAAAALRLGGLDGFASDYGVLLALKITALLILGTFGLVQRRRLTGAVTSAADGLGRLVAAEAVVMLSAAGLAVALSRTAPPPGDGRPLTTAEDLLGRPLPDALDSGDWFTAWALDGFWLPVALVAIVAYVVGVRRLRSRGDGWSLGRTVAWLAGWLLFIWATNGAPGVYGRVLFSMHMVQHMVIATIVPVLIVLGAPVTLALRALPKRDDRSMGPREWLLAAVHSPLVVVLGNPVVAGFLFISSIVAFYTTSLLDLSLSTHTGHVLMTAHFLITGYLFLGCLIGIDPGPSRPAFPMRVILLLVVFGSHAFFSVSMMASDQVLAEDWFSGLGRDWGPELLDDQYVGASLGWVLGEAPLLMVMVAMLALWFAADRRESARHDRSEDRTGEEELRSYNERLARLAGRDAASEDRRLDG